MMTNEPEDRNRESGIELRALVLEQQRLRSDIEQLLQENRRLREQDGGGKGGSHNGGDGKGQEEGKGQDSQKPDQQEKKADEKKQDDSKKEESKKPKPPFLQRVRTWTRAHPVAAILIVLAVVILIVAGYLLMQYLGSYVSTDDAEIDGHMHEIGSRLAGTVIGVYTEDNRSVQAGQTLVELDPRDYLSALKQAQANLAQAQANVQAEEPNVPITQTTQATNVRTEQLEVTNAEAAVLAAQQSYQSALADVRQAEAGAANAQREEERYRGLVAKEEVSHEDYDQRATNARAQAALVTARQAAADAAYRAIQQKQAALNEARERAREAESNRPRQEAVQHATLATRRANVQAAQAQVEQAGLNLSYCKILAPIAGIIGNKTVEVGQQVAPGQELLAITPTDDLWVTANFKETQIEHMSPGQNVTIHVDALNLDFTGYVQNMPGATGARYSLLPPENATGNYIKVVQRLPVRLRFKPNQPGAERLRIGMSVEPKVWIK